MGNRCKTGCGKWASDGGLCRSCSREGRSPSNKVSETPLSTPRLAHNKQPARLFSAAVRGDANEVRELLTHPFFDADENVGTNTPVSDVNEKVSNPHR